MGGLFTWPNQDDRMNMTEIGEHDWKTTNINMVNFVGFGGLTIQV